MRPAELLTSVGLISFAFYPDALCMTAISDVKGIPENITESRVKTTHTMYVKT